MCSNHAVPFTRPHPTHPLHPTKLKGNGDAKPVEEPGSVLMALLAVGVIGSFTLNGISMEKITGREVRAMVNVVD